ncbi:unnamed protein product [Symbiodinium necroappetens]|uniref:Uncharacterized protein n=1 Tax=Symbiodinium necroappetens TaxID=1628268 RepID=A0A812ZNS1_9DINO|nr:unnamed protein product [Symbiodinium necroappetens]|mmetsp:Transcript_119806/g.284655  ORF Transcript_119806/g.284655 Transcript_119806/m.284655 type:complete len:116 (-) Transcript_119806:184-531(-)
MAGQGKDSHAIVADKVHAKTGFGAIWAVVAKLLIRLRYLGLFGYALEWLLEACHSSSKLHTMLHRINTPKFHLLAITMVLAGHVAEHLHQEEENHHQEAHLASLRAELQKLRHSD